jgi:cytochrome c biogenesis protein CcdA
VKRLALAAAVLAALAAPAAALAHPLGNFTVNRYARVQPSGDRVYVLYVLDMAEIPTFQAGKIDARAYARRIARGAELSVDGRPTRLVAGATALAHPAGAGGLRTTRLEVVLEGPVLSGPGAIRYRDTNDAERIGWREIVVGKDARSASDELRAYPKDLLQSPLDERSVAVTLAPGTGPATPPTPRHAALLGLIVTATHTAGVFALGLVTLLLSRFVVPDRLYPWLNLASGLLVVGIGTSVLWARWRHAQAHRRHEHHHHHHHHHEYADGISARSLVAVGVSGGLLPCPSALVVLLAAISLHRVAFGLVLIVAFSAGLALSITGIGLAAVLAKRAFRRLSFDGRIAGLLPAASALVILVAGLAMTAHALPKVR